MQVGRLRLPGDGLLQVPGGGFGPPGLKLDQRHKMQNLGQVRLPALNFRKLRLRLLQAAGLEVRHRIVELAVQGSGGSRENGGLACRPPFGRHFGQLAPFLAAHGWCSLRLQLTFLFHRHAFRQVPGLVHVCAFDDGGMVGKKLHRDRI